MTEGNAATIPDSNGSDADDAVVAVVGVIGTTSDGNASVISTYY